MLHAKECIEPLDSLKSCYMAQSAVHRDLNSPCQPNLPTTSQNDTPNPHQPLTTQVILQDHGGIPSESNLGPSELSPLVDPWIHQFPYSHRALINVIFLSWRTIRKFHLAGNDFIG